jgi:Leucine-rich repeat (LRR) protein
MGALEILDIDGPVQKIPPWIGRLKSLRQIKVHWCDGGDRKVPDEIGDLPKLKSFWLLDFTDNHGFSLPSSIGNLAQLRELILADVSALPDEIGNLTRLEYLWVRTSVFTSLPSSIGALQNLKYLIMNVSVPHWIGTLTKLEELRLGGEKITSLPASIGKLVSLKVLSLQNTRNLKGLPDEISNLSNLTTLKLLDSGIASFPLSDIDMSARETKRSFDLYKFLTNFKNLRTLALVNDFFENKFQEKVLLKLVSELPLLSCLGNTKVKDPAIFYSLARNRVRSRILHSNGRTYQDVSFPSLSLWPWIMARARAAFTRSNCREKSCLCGSWDICAISEADAIFLLLVEYGSNFLSLGSDVPQKLLRAGTD